MKPSRITVIFFTLAVAAVLIGQSTQTPPILWYLIPLALALLAMLGYGAFLLYPVFVTAGLIATAWLLLRS